MHVTSVCYKFKSLKRILHCIAFRPKKSLQFNTRIRTYIVQKTSLFFVRDELTLLFAALAFIPLGSYEPLRTCTFLEKVPSRLHCSLKTAFPLAKNDLSSHFFLFGKGVYLSVTSASHSLCFIFFPSLILCGRTQYKVLETQKAYSAKSTTRSAEKKVQMKNEIETVTYRLEFSRIK